MGLEGVGGPCHCSAPGCWMLPYFVGFGLWGGVRYGQDPPSKPRAAGYLPGFALRVPVALPFSGNMRHAMALGGKCGLCAGSVGTETPGMSVDKPCLSSTHWVYSSHKCYKWPNMGSAWAAYSRTIAKKYPGMVLKWGWGSPVPIRAL